MLLQLFLFILSKVASGKFKITYVAYIRFYYTVLNYLLEELYKQSLKGL